METTTNVQGYAAAATDDATAAADAVLIAFAQTKGAEVSDWMRRYPAHASDLARLAADKWAGVTEVEERTAISSSDAPAAAAAARFRDIGIAALRACRTAPAQPTAVMATFSNLLRAAKEKGWEAEALAARLEIPYGLLFKLHRRLLAPDSLPRALVARLAESIGRTADEVNAYLRQPASLAAGASYRSDDMPQVGAQETFADALTDDPETTDEQRRRWQCDDNTE